MLPALKVGGVQEIFEEYRLKDVLGVRLMLQMKHAQTPDSVSVSFDCLIGLLLTAHMSFPSFSPARTDRLPYQRPHPRPPPQRPP